jgi:hypothetical protein
VTALDHAPGVNQLGDAIQRLAAQVGVLECCAHQTMRGRSDDDFIGSGQPLESHGKTGRFTGYRCPAASG